VKRALSLVVMTALLVLALSGVALAATAQDIYDDYAMDLKLDGHYTEAELRAYLGDATVHQYGDPTLGTGLDTMITTMLTTDSRGDFPFTGAQIAMMAVGAAILIGGGLALRHYARSRD
jgi:hypothetical protein